MRRHLVIPAASVLLVLAALLACGKGGSETPPASDSSAGVSGQDPAALPEPAGAPAPTETVEGSVSDSGPGADPVVVEVNGRPIRAGRLVAAVEMNRMRARAMGHAMTAEEEAGLREAALSAFVADELLHQAAQADGIAPSEAQVAEEVKTLRAGFASPEEYREFLRQAGMTEAGVSEDAARRFTVRTYVKKFAGNVAVSEAEARAFYEANTPQFELPEQVRAAIIVVLSKPADAEPLRAEARQRIAEAHKRAVAGEDFATLARQYSQVPNAANGGDLGMFGRGDGLFPKIEDMTFSTPPGQISPVFETPSGLCVVKTLEKAAPRVRSFAEVKPLLVEELGRQKEDAAVEARVNDLHAAAKIEMKDPSFLRSPGAASSEAGTR